MLLRHRGASPIVPHPPPPMCRRCIAAIRRHFPDFPPEKTGAFLMAISPYPWGQPEDIEAAVERVWRESDGTVEGAIAVAAEWVRD